MSSIQFFGALQLGFIFSLVAIGVYLSFKVIQFPDLTVDGSFPLGAAVAATLIYHGGNPYIATLVAMMSGALVGFVTGWLSTHLKILNLLAGILVMTSLYSINLRIMGRPNIALIGDYTIFTSLESYTHLLWIPLGLIVAGALFIVHNFLCSRIGLALRATGNNDRMARAAGINDKKMVWLGLGLSNALIALGGALYAQLHGFADITMGVGTVIIGLAAVIIGESLLPVRTVFQALSACIVGAIIYRLFIAMALNIDGLGLQTSDLNFVTAILVVLAMVLPKLKKKSKESALSKTKET